MNDWLKKLLGLNGGLDPVFLSAVQKLQSRLSDVKEAGIEVTPDNIDEFLKAETQGKYGLADYRKLQEASAPNMLRAVGYGLSMNQLDNILGLFSKKAATESRVREEAYAERHPLHAMAGSLVGALVSGKGIDESVVGPLLGETHGIADAIKAGALAGGTYGAVDAAGRADDKPLGGKLRDAAMGGLAGTLVGGTLGGTFAAGAKVFQPKASGVNRITGAVAKEGGYDKVMENLDEATKAGRGEDVVLADLSPHLAKALDFAANASDNVLVPTAELLESRTAGRAARLLEDVRAHMGEPARLVNPRPAISGAAEALRGEPDFGLRAAQLSRNTSDIGDLYDELAAKNPTFDVSSLPLDKPKIAQMWQRARLAGNLSGTGPMDDLIARLTAANPAAPKSALQAIARQYGGNAERPVTLSDLTALRRALNGQVDAAFRSGNGDLGNSLKTIRQQVDDALEAGAPGFKEINAQYYGAKNLERAVESGHDWWLKADKRALARAVDALRDQPGAIDEFRLGVASGLVEKLQGTATNRDAARELMQASEDLDAKLKLIFGDQRTFESFMQRAKVEREMGRLSKTIGGSETARRMEAKGYSPEELGVDALTHGPGVLARAGAGLAKNALRQRAANQMGPLLLTQGAPNIRRVLQMLQQTPDLYGGADIPAFGRRLRFDQFLRSGAPAGLMSTFYPMLSNDQ